MTAAKTSAPKKTAPDVFAECSGCFRERRLTDEDVLVAHRAWYGMRIGMQDCPGAGLAPAESVSLV